MEKLLNFFKNLFKNLLDQRVRVELKFVSKKLGQPLKKKIKRGELFFFPKAH